MHPARARAASTGSWGADTPSGSLSRASLRPLHWAPCSRYISLRPHNAADMSVSCHMHCHSRQRWNPCHREADCHLASGRLAYAWESSSVHIRSRQAFPAAMESAEGCELVAAACLAASASASAAAWASYGELSLASKSGYCSSCSTKRPRCTRCATWMSTWPRHVLAAAELDASDARPPVKLLWLAPTPGDWHITADLAAPSVLRSCSPQSAHWGQFLSVAYCWAYKGGRGLMDTPGSMTENAQSRDSRRNQAAQEPS